jgi:endonuclease-3
LGGGLAQIRAPGATLIEVVATLRRDAPRPAVLTDPLQLILWENIGYLIDDERRAALFNAFEAAVGFDVEAIASVDDAVLALIAQRCGMRPETRVERWREIARIVLEDCDGDLGQALRAAPIGKARALLKRFPTIGDPGADKVLLFSGVAARPCLESNGLRSLARLGFLRERPSYAASYAAAIDVLASQGRPDRDWLIDAYLTLRDLGRGLCKRGEPNCHACRLDAVCGRMSVAAL